MALTAVDRAVSAASHATRRIRGQEVLYRRGTTLELVVTHAVMGAKNWATEALYTGVRVGDKPTDWLIQASALVTGEGEQVIPRRGDEIETTDGMVFRVMPFGPDDQLWEWHDRGRTTLRIHTAERDPQQ